MSHHDTHDCKITGPHAHPEDFGAVADGKTDCTDAFRRAFESAPTVVAVAGTYLLGDALGPSIRELTP